MSARRRASVYMAGWRRGAVGLPKLVPMRYVAQWDYATQSVFFRGYESGERSAKRASERADREVAARGR